MRSHVCAAPPRRLRQARSPLAPADVAQAFAMSARRIPPQASGGCVTCPHARRRRHDAAPASCRAGRLGPAQLSGRRGAGPVVRDLQGLGPSPPRGVPPAHALPCPRRRTASRAATPGPRLTARDLDPRLDPTVLRWVIGPSGPGEPIMRPVSRVAQPQGHREAGAPGFSGLSGSSWPRGGMGFADGGAAALPGASIPLVLGRAFRRSCG